MELVGKSVTKEFKGFGFFEGVIESFDSATGFYRVSYEDGDSEEIDFSEVSRLLSDGSHSGSISGKVAGKKVGRKPKRRRRNGLRDPGKLDDSSVVDDGDLHENLVIESDLGHNLENNADDSVSVNVIVIDNRIVAGNGNLDGGLDLNRGLNFDNGVTNGGVVGCIDLNVSAENGEFDENGGSLGKVGSLGGVGGEEGKKERGFDLNLGFDDEGTNGMSGRVDGEACVGLGEELRNGDVGQVNSNDVDCGTSDGQSEGGGLEGVTPTQHEDGNSSRRKRRKVEKVSSSMTKSVLRRSARRAKAATSTESTTPSSTEEDGLIDVSVYGISEEKPIAARHAKVINEPEVPPLKIDLPPSSANLNLEGIPVVDLFSVYSCLRSFSTLLYLSPFGLEDFVAALKSRVSNLLIDSIHVSIMQTLRKHLEFLANDGCESASNCLRNLNWDLLDEITWPVFMVEYLLIHGSRLKPGFSLIQLKLFDSGYYKQSEDVKIELLRCLCDDVVEVEAIRSELSRRRMMVDANMEVDRTFNGDASGKRKISSDASGDSLLGEDVEEVADGNSDECCLCKMDGNLICCDGCPAAYHSKCVGIVSSLLPEGDWYCPECTTSGNNAGTKSRKSIRGAELLGIDLYGRLFFSCFDYLLVSDSYDADSSFSYYHKDDLSAVIQLLESSSISYASIRSSILQNWAMPTVSVQLESDVNSDKCTLENEDSIEEQITSSITGCPSHLGTEGPDPPDGFGLGTVKHCTATKDQLSNTKRSDEVVLQANGVLESHRPLSDQIARGTAKRVSAANRKKKQSASVQSRSSDVKVKEEGGLQALSENRIINSYKFGRTAASVVEELLRKPSDKGNVDTPKTEEKIISIQSKFIMKKSSKFYWATIQQRNGERQKENCGWCYCCRFPVEDRVCLFSIKNGYSIPKSLKADIDVILSERKNEGHLADIICNIVCMEERLRGLLLGPWLSPQYCENWRKGVLKASDVSSLKHPLLMLESNLHPLALSADWFKHVDYVATMGSASHFVASARGNSKNGTTRKKGKHADSETKSSSAGSGLSLFWWRGGRTSRSLFNWKVIPRSFALKAARKAGFMKVPELLYSDSTENTKRSKYVVWRAAVEASRSLDQLALQVRDLDLFIRWDDIENTQPHFLLDKEAMKSIRLFKKVTIRRKCLEGTISKYLLDFGKRRCIPEVVIKHGLKLEDSDSERKKYWLNEAYVPLYLIKNFEERRIVRMAGKSKSSVVRKGGRKMRKLSEEKGFEYLFERAAMSDSYQCGQCKKDVPISEAVSCQLCNGFFHKRHAMKSSEGNTAICTYACLRCRAVKKVKSYTSQGKKKLGKLLHGKKLKVGRPRGRPKKVGNTLHQYQRMSLRNDKKLQNHEQLKGKRVNNHQQPSAVKNTDVSAGVTLRRSARTAKCVTLKPDVLVGARKRKRKRTVDVELKKSSKVPLLKKRRTHVFHAFWTNGLQLSRKPKDERVTNFKRKSLCVAFESSGGVSGKPKCSLCLEPEFKSALMYIACDICEVWFHGEAFGLNRRNIKNVIGFKCHVCLEKTAPVCPFASHLRVNVADSIEATSEAEDTQVLPEVGSDTGKDGLLEFPSNEGPPGLPEMTLQSVDESSDKNKAPLVESGLEMKNVSAAQVLPEVGSDMGKASLLEFHSNEGPAGLPETTLQSVDDEISNKNKAPLVEPGLEMKSASSEVICNSIEGKKKVSDSTEG